ncbi:MAG: hypothetical protein ACRD2X_16115 [Vicinamibacteraceae bacterium]
MALNAVFTATTDQFRSEIERAKQVVVGWRDDTKRTNAELSRLGESFSGQQIISKAQAAAAAVDRIGGASKLTAAEQSRLNGILNEAIAKYAALGQQAPAHLKKLQAETAKIQTTTTAATAGVTGITASLTKMAGPLAAAFSVQQVISFGKSVIDLGGDINDLSQKTGLSIKAVQQFGFAAEQGGSDIETVGKAVNNMARQVIDGSSTTKRALDNLGLSFDDIKKLSPEDAFIKVAKAIASTTDPMVQSHAAMSLFGRAGAELLPAIKDGFLEVAESAATMSDDTVKALARAGDEIDKFQHNLTIATGTSIAAIGGLIKAVGDLPGAVSRATQDASGFFDRFVRSLNGGIGGVSQAIGSALVEQEVDAAVAASNVTRGNAPSRAGLLKSGGPTGVTGSGDDGEESALEKKLKRTRDNVADLSTEISLALSKNLVSNEEVIKRWGDTVVKAGEDLRFLGIPIAEMPREFREFHAEVVAGRQALEAAKSAVVGATIEYGKLSASVSELQDGTFSAAFDTAVPALKITRDHVDNLNDSLGEVANQSGLINDAIQRDNEALMQSISDLGGAFSNLANISGGAFGGILQNIGEMIALMDVAAKTGDSVSKGIQTIGRVGGLNISSGTADTIGAFAGAGLTAFSSGYSVAQETDSRTKGVLSGAASGALAGVPLAAATGGLSIAVGAGIGAIGGLFKGDGDEERDAFTEEQGGFDALSRKLHNRNQDLLFENLQLAESTGEVEAAIKDIETVLSEYEKRLGSLANSLDVVGQKQGVISTDQIAAIQELGGTADGKQVTFDFLQQQTQSAADGIERLVTNAESVTKRSATAIGASLGSIFKEMQTQGASTIDILRTLEPQIDAFEGLLAEAGIASVPGFTALNRQLNVLQDESLGPLIESALGAGQAMAGLGNTLLLTEGQFDGLNSVITDAHRTLTLTGHGGRDALVLLQQPLQTAWQLSNDFGFTLDKNTARLVKQAEEAGVVGEKMRPLAEQQLKATEALVDRLDELMVALGVKLPEAGTKGAKALDKELKKIKPPKIEGHVTWKVDAIPGTSAPSTSRKPPKGLAEGTIVSSPTFALIGEGAESEVVAPYSDYLNTVATAASKMARSERRSSKSGPVHITIVQDGRETARAVLPYLEDAMRVYVGR